MAKIPGQEIRLGSEKYVLAPITLAQFVELEDDFDKLMDADCRGSERFRIISRFVVASLKRNYQSIPIDGISVPIDETMVMSNLLDMGNREDALTVVLGISGLESASPGEAQAGNGKDDRSPASSTDLPSLTDQITQVH